MRVRPDLKAKVVFMGTSGVGKTSIILRHDRQSFSADISSTLGANFVHTTLTTMPPSSKRVELEIWDTAGQERFTCMMPMYIRNAAGAFIVFDVTNRDSFTDLSKWLFEVDKTDRLSEMALVIVANKIDLEKRRAVTTAEGAAFAEQRGCLYAETSALWDRGIAEVMHIMAEALVKRAPSAASPSKSNVDDVIQPASNTNDNGRCC